MKKISFERMRFFCFEKYHKIDYSDFLFENPINKNVVIFFKKKKRK